MWVQEHAHWFDKRWQCSLHVAQAWRDASGALLPPVAATLLLKLTLEQVGCGEGRKRTLLLAPVRNHWAQPHWGAQGQHETLESPSQLPFEMGGGVLGEVSSSALLADESPNAWESTCWRIGTGPVARGHHWFVAPPQPSLYIFLWPGQESAAPHPQQTFAVRFPAPPQEMKCHQGDVTFVVGFFNRKVQTNFTCNAHKLETNISQQVNTV